MKLIDILVEELPKRGGWPDGAVECYWHRGFDVAHFYDSLRNEVPNPIYIRGASLCGGDGCDVVITREQYDAALSAKNDGWIEWGGGECPVEKGTLIDVKHRDGEIYQNKPAMGENNSRWSHTGSHGDIIAYRLHKPQEVGQAKADLNECTSQDAAPVWNGEGVIPPVGCVCERSWAGDEWQQCKILFASNHLVVVKLKESGREDAYNIGDVIFRTSRTERDKAIEEMIKIATMHTTKSLGLDLALNSIHNAIAAGKIPGVKLEGL